MSTKYKRLYSIIILALACVQNIIASPAGYKQAHPKTDPNQILN